MIFVHMATTSWFTYMQVPPAPDLHVSKYLQVAADEAERGALESQLAHQATLVRYHLTDAATQAAGEKERGGWGIY